MTKAEYIELIKIELTAGSPLLKQGAKFHDVTIEKHIAMVVNEVITQAQYRDSSIFEQFSVNYPEQPILTAGTKKYTNLPASPLFTKNINGVWVYPGGVSYSDDRIPFFSRKKNSDAVYGSLEVNTVMGGNVYYLRGQEIIYKRIAPDITTVDINLVTSFDELPEDAKLYMPDGRDSFIFTMVMEQLKGSRQFPTKRRSDADPDSQ